MAKGGCRKQGVVALLLLSFPMKFNKLDKDTQLQLRQGVLLMRFRSTTPKSGARKYVSYRRIAQVFNLSENQVQHICRYRHHQSPVTRCRRRLHKLSQSHVRYLIDRETLRSWAGYTLAERTALFERRFHSKRLAVTTLRRVYLTNGVKRKKVRQEKVMPMNAWANFDDKRRELI
jgi:hypothetical protein